LLFGAQDECIRQDIQGQQQEDGKSHQHQVDIGFEKKQAVHAGLG
jgi:hypothetical protein